MTWDATLCEDLWDKILKAIAQGHNAFLFWGFNKVSIEILHRLASRGLTNSVSGVVDPNPRFIGKRIEEFKVLSPDRILNIQVDTIVVSVDEQKEEALRSFVKFDRCIPLVLMSGMKHLDFLDSTFHQLLSSCLVPSRAWGYQHMLIHIYQCLKYIAKRQLKGNIAEFGIYKGGTTVFIAKALIKLGIDAKIFAFDTFAGFPNRKSLLDLYDDPHDVFDDFSAVESYCKPFNIHLIRGDISETYRRIQGIPLILSFFDTDNYTPTKSALEMCYEQTVQGGVIACDHYYCEARWLYTIGERMAVTEFMTDKNVFNLHGTGIFIKL